MPISPTQVRDVIESKVDARKVNDTAIEIDNKLSDSEYARNWVMNKEKNPSYSFVFRGSLSAAEKNLIIRMYSEAGWGSVSIRNSEDTGERPGLFSVTLKTLAE